jgi:hypothetical protein
MNNHILIQRIGLASNGVSKSLSKSFINLSLSLPSIITSYTPQQNNCSIEIFSAYHGVEQAYISGTLFRDVEQTCSCYTRYPYLEQFGSRKHRSEETALNQLHSIGRVVWCVGACLEAIINWCKNESYRDYCQKHVVLFDLSDEGLEQRIDHYPFFAAVYRNYLRHGTGNHLSYLTQYMTKLPRTNDTLHIHRTLN